MNNTLKWLNSILTSKNAYNEIKNNLDRLYSIIPELKECENYDQKNPYHPHLLLEHILQTFIYERSNEFIPRLALLLHDIGKPNVMIKNQKGYNSYPGHGKASAEKSEIILERLGLDDFSKFKTLTLISIHDTRFPEEKEEEISLLMRGIFAKEDNKYVKFLNEEKRSNHNLRKDIIAQMFYYFISIREADVCAQDHIYIIERIEKIQRLKDLYNKWEWTTLSKA